MFTGRPFPANNRRGSLRANCRNSAYMRPGLSAACPAAGSALTRTRIRKNKTLDMFQPGKFTTVVRSMAEVPPRAVNSVKPRIAGALGMPVSAMFPEFAAAFPLTTAMMEAHWSQPFLAVRDMGGGWVVYLLLEREGHNLFFDDPFPIYADRDYFDTSMMPERWIPLYRSFSSFVITDQSTYSLVAWRDTPMGRSKDVEDFAKLTNIRKSRVKALQGKLRVAQTALLRLWMLTDNLDSLWIDEEHRDRNVYHVHGDAFSNAYRVGDPGEMLDRYLAHVVSGGAPKDFDIRAW